MKTIAEIQSELRILCAELETIKAAQQPETKEINFRQIISMAYRYPINGHPLANEHEHIKDMYLTVLLSVAVLDEEQYEESLMTICRIASGMHFEGNIEELFLSAKSIKFDVLDECTRLFINSEKKLILLLESMLIAASFNKNRRRGMEYISELSVLLKIDKKDMTFLANLARVILTQNLREYKTDIPNCYGTLFDCYIVNFKNEFKIELIEAVGRGNFRNKNYGPDYVDCYLYATSVKDGKIELQYVSYDLYGPRGGCHVNATSEISTNNYIIDYLKEKINDYPKFSNVRSLYSFSVIIPNRARQLKKSQKIILGVMSNHPLAHSMAMEKYIAAGGIIEESEEQ